MKKIKKTELYRPDLEGTLDEVIAHLQKYAVDYPEYDSIIMEEESAFEGGYYHNVYGCRPETDAEEKMRELAEENQKIQNQEWQRAQYEKLKAIFEKP
jgi:hypothetical protein